jgi:hypothetical protein
VCCYIIHQNTNAGIQRWDKIVILRTKNKILPKTLPKSSKSNTKWNLFTIKNGFEITNFHFVFKNGNSKPNRSQSQSNPNK